MFRSRIFAAPEYTVYLFPAIDYKQINETNLYDMSNFVIIFKFF